MNSNNEMGKSTIVEIPDSDLWIYATCGFCKFWRQLKQAPGSIIGGPKIGDCFGVPPSPLMTKNPNGVVGSPNEFALSFVQPRLPEQYPACGLFKLASDKMLPVMDGVPQN